MDLRERVDDLMPGVRKDLEDLVRIPSVSASPDHQDDVRRSAEATAALFEAEGFEVNIRTVEGSQPAVVARKAGPEGAPTVLLYAHHDVQPTGPLDAWESKPFEPTERGDRMYGRGAADDKAGIGVHLASVRAHGDDLPVGVTVLVEGEEEIGSPKLQSFLDTYQDELAADVIVIADSTNWDIGTPALTTSLRGMIAAEVEVRTLSHGVHSGMWGGVVPDALTTLVRLLATLHDDSGTCAIEGLHSGPAADLDYPEDRVRAESGVLDQVSLVGTGSVVERIWTQPSVAVLALDTTRIADVSNTLIPAARAYVGLRLAPGDTMENGLACLTRHLEQHAPWGAEVTVVPEDDGGEPIDIDATGPAYDAARSAFEEAWDGEKPVDIGVGGTIPLAAAFRDAFPGASILITGVEDPDTRAHGANEGLHLAEFRRACLAEAFLLRNLGQIPR